MDSRRLLMSRNAGSPSKRPARRGKHWSSGWYALAVALLLVATGAVAPHAQSRGQGRGPQHRADRADRQLAERLNQGDGNDRERVIITLKPGAKRWLLQELQAQGERADKDFGVIEAFAGRLPRRMLRQLRNHPDVVSMSTDAPVTSMQSSPVGTVFTVTNTNNSGAGSLRQAILDANGRAGADTIWFNIPLTDANHVYYRDNGVAGTFGTPVATTTPDGAILDFDADYVAGHRAIVVSHLSDGFGPQRDRPGDHRRHDAARLRGGARTGRGDQRRGRHRERRQRPHVDDGRLDGTRSGDQLGG